MGSTEVVEHREGNDQSSSRKLPGRTKHEPNTLKHGVTLDSEFTNWTNRLGNFS